MAYTLFFFDPAASRLDARSVYERVETEADATAAGNSRRVIAFVEEAYRRLPMLEQLETEESTNPTYSGHYFMVHLPLSFDEELVSRLVEIARSFGVAVYDPQMDAE